MGIAVSMLVLSAGCGKREAPGARSGRGAAVALNGGGAGNPSPVAGTAAPGDRKSVPAAPARIGVTVKPSSPSRVAPPRLFAEGGAFVDNLAFRGVAWLVNGVVAADGDRLPPDAFSKGDRIQARGTVVAGGREIPFTTPAVVAVDSPPEIGGARLEPKAPTTGSKVKVVADGTDPDGDPVTMKVRWFVDDAEVPGNGSELSLVGVKRGSWVHARIATSDGTMEGSWMNTPKYQVVNALPVVTSRVPAEVPPDRKFRYRIEAQDPDGDPLTYSLSKAPSGMVLSGSTLEWDVPDDALGKTVEVEVAISDGNGGQTICTISMNIHAKGRAPGAVRNG